MFGLKDLVFASASGDGKVDIDLYVDIFAPQISTHTHAKFPNSRVVQKMKINLVG